MSFYGQEFTAETDRDGFFEFRFEPSDPLPEDRSWHDLHLELLAPEDRTQDRVTATGHVIVPRPDVEFGHREPGQPGEHVQHHAQPGHAHHEGDDESDR